MPAVRELIMPNADSLGNVAANRMREAVLNSESLSAAVVGRDDTGDHEARAAAAGEGEVEKEATA